MTPPLFLLLQLWRQRLQPSLCRDQGRGTCRPRPTAPRRSPPGFIRTLSSGDPPDPLFRACPSLCLLGNTSAPCGVQDPAPALEARARPTGSVAAPSSQTPPCPSAPTPGLPQTPPCPLRWASSSTWFLPRVLYLGMHYPPPPSLPGACGSRDSRQGRRPDSEPLLPFFCCSAR